VVWSFVYLALCRLVQLVVRLCRSERSKELEILVLRHELAILRRQPRRVPFRPVDRAMLAALARALPRSAWTSLSVRPATLLRWHRQLVRRRWTCPHRQPGQPPLDRRLQALVARLARENPGWGYRRIVGELQRLGIAVSASSVRTIVLRHGLPPAPQRDELSWRNFLRQQAATTLACDFFTVGTAWLKRIYVLFFISLERRRIEFVACTPNLTGAWVAQQARNLLMTLDDPQQPLRFLIHDRDAKFSGGFDHVLRSEGIAVIRTPVRAPNANAHTERWVGSVRRECLDRLLIFSRRQLEHVLHVYTRHYNQHRPHRALALRPPEQADGDPTPLRARPDLQLNRTDPARRPDPRIQTRSLRSISFRTHGPHKLFGTSTYSKGSRARAWISDRPGRRQLLARPFRSSPDSLWRIECASFEPTQPQRVG
jgi:transposase InsO family protein